MKGKQRKIMQKIIDRRKKQIKILEEEIIKPLKDNLKIAIATMQNQDSIEHFERHTKIIDKRIKEIFKR